MRASTLSVLLACSAAAAPDAGSAALTAAPAIWDGKCFYPVPSANFKLDTFTGRWYRVAGTKASFSTPGCKCTIAEYALNGDGTVKVSNSCELNGEKKGAEGFASPVSANYGAGGVFRVNFPGRREGPNTQGCKGPTYIVQEYTGDVAIIGSSNFTNVGILSRKQNLDGKVIDDLIKRAGELGGDLSQVEKIDQTNCKINK